MRIRIPATILLIAATTLAIGQKSVQQTTAHHTVKHKATAHSAGIDSERATQIQTALIKQGYLAGEPSGVWDSQTVAAMQKLQADNGWQTKITPDARALNKLGLGSQPVAATQPPQ